VCNGVIFPVTSEEFTTYNEREVGYQPTKSHPSRITMLDGSHSAPADHQGEGAPFAQGNLRQTNPSLLSCPARPLDLSDEDIQKICEYASSDSEVACDTDGKDLVFGSKN
jgi:hypothetical protein